MAIISSVNKRTGLSRDLSIFFRADQYLRLEDVDAELTVTAQAGTSGPPQLKVEQKNDNSRGKRNANDSNSGGKKDNRPKCFKDNAWYDMYTNLTDTTENIYLAT